MFKDDKKFWWEVSELRENKKVIQSAVNFLKSNKVSEELSEEKKLQLDDLVKKYSISRQEAYEWLKPFWGS